MSAGRGPEVPVLIRRKNETKQGRSEPPNPRRPSREGAKQTSGGKEDNDIPHKGVIRMIAGGPSGGDSHQARKSQVREAHQISIKEVLDIETMEDAPIIQFGRAERSGPQTIHNDALIITAMIANYEVGRIFIDSRSSADILFEKAYDQMQLGDVSLEKVDTSLYGFAGEVVHPRGMVSLPLTMGKGTTRKTCLLKFLVVDVPSTYNVILDRPTLNTFQAMESIYHMKIKFPTSGEWEKCKEILPNPENAMSRLSVKDKKGMWTMLLIMSLLVREEKRLKEKTQKKQKPPLRFSQRKNCLTLRSYLEILTRLHELALT
ncbi:UNVERIFIED_CONTAM: hypothetical protein Slati_0095000 [Sesamum latifolium]|uniref:Uncharacterized protein n=1 Tax=Sesamum latifolium TaxID=2727402 RepID=A0AAW2Y8N2_9LAMI